jgi:hypothetical protein
MDLVTFWGLAFGIWTADLPALELRALATQAGLSSAAADRWDAIGTYSLKGERTVTTVKLYYEDTDSIADKVERKGGFGGRIFPNFLSIHALYRMADGPWKHKKLYSAARVGFWKVAKVRPQVVTIQVRSKMVFYSNDPIRFTVEEMERIYKPVSMRLTLKDGVPELK